MTAATIVNERVEQSASSTRTMYRDGFALVGSAGLTAVVGIAFWALAARLVPAERLGVDTGQIALITAVGSACAVGVGNGFTALLPRAGAMRSSLLRHGYLITAVCAAVLGLVASLLATTASRVGISGPADVITTTAAIVVWALFVVEDSALTGLGKAAWLPAANGAVSVVKLGLLAVIVTSVSRPAVISTIAPAAIAVLLVSGVIVPARLRRCASGAATTFTRGTLRAFALRDGVASALSLGLLMMLPFVVTQAAGPAEGAVFAICLALAQGLDLITAGVGVSLTVHAAEGAKAATALALSVWRRVVVLVAVSAGVLLASAHVLLGFFGETYVTRGGVAVIAVLAGTSIIRTAFIMWASLMRAQRRTGLVLVFNASVAALMLPLVVTLARSHGAVGAAIGVAAAQVLLSFAVVCHVIKLRRQS
ncbi:MAG: hypothetical protein JWM93_1854 [Frankiales bacterium]|nr:hypothetical protein [Frankiales bacterium]